MTRKEQIMDEIHVRQKQITRIQSEIVTLWGQYYAENGEYPHGVTKPKIDE